MFLVSDSNLGEVWKVFNMERRALKIRTPKTPMEEINRLAWSNAALKLSANMSGETLRAQYYQVLQARQRIGYKMKREEKIRKQKEAERLHQMEIPTRVDAMLKIGLPATAGALVEKSESDRLSDYRKVIEKMKENETVLFVFDSPDAMYEAANHILVKVVRQLKITRSVIMETPKVAAYREGHPVYLYAVTKLRSA